MYRFRTPELFLGCFLTVAVFAAGMLFVPAFSQREQSNQQQQSANATNHEAAPNSTDERLANYTWWLAVLTGVLAASTVGLWIGSWRSGVKQSRDMIASINVADRAAKAAELNAKAAINVELPVVALDTMRLYRTAGVTGNVVGHPGELTEPRITFKNHGRTAAELIALCVEWAVENKLPEIPIYKTSFPYVPGTFLVPDGAFPAALNNYVIRLKPDEITATEEESKHLWVFGYLDYRDFIGNPHQMRFCAKWQPYGPTRADGTRLALGFVYDSETPPEYSRKT
jgi:hypothetical protein